MQIKHLILACKLSNRCIATSLKARTLNLIMCLSINIIRKQYSHIKHWCSFWDGETIYPKWRGGAIIRKPIDPPPHVYVSVIICNHSETEDQKRIPNKKFLCPWHDPTSFSQFICPWPHPLPGTLSIHIVLEFSFFNLYRLSPYHPSSWT